MNLKIATSLLLLVVVFYAETTYAARPRVEPACSAERFVPCSSFSYKRTIGKHTTVDIPAFNNSRGKGTWTVTVGYEPRGKCAKVSFYVNTLVFSPARSYERVFSGGGGSISDSGVFDYKLGDLESALKVHNGLCYVPAPDPPPKGRPDPQTQMTSADLKERQALDEERERQELEEERERLALEEERERLALEEERKKGEEERERLRLAEERREQERRRELARQRRLERDRQRQRDLAIQRRLEQERSRRRALARQRQLEREKQEQAEGAAAMEALTTGIGILGGIIQHKNQMRSIRRNTPSRPTYSRPTYTPLPSGQLFKCRPRDMACGLPNTEECRLFLSRPVCPE